MLQEWTSTNPILLQLSSSLLGYSRVLEPAGLWAGRSRAPIQGNSHPAGKCPALLPLPQADRTGQSSQMALDFLSWLPVVLIEKGRCLAENWMIFRSSFEDDSFRSPFPLTARQVGFPGFPTGARWPKSSWGTIWVKHHVHCSILCPAQWILPGSAQALMDPKQSTLPDKP